MLGLFACGMYIHHRHILYIEILSQTDQPPCVLCFIVRAASLMLSAVVSHPTLLAPSLNYVLMSPFAQWEYDDQCSDTYGKDLYKSSLGRWLSIPGLSDSDVSHPWGDPLRQSLTI